MIHINAHSVDTPMRAREKLLKLEKDVRTKDEECAAAQTRLADMVAENQTMKLQEVHSIGQYHADHLLKQQYLMTMQSEQQQYQFEEKQARDEMIQHKQMAEWQMEDVTRKIKHELYEREMEFSRKCRAELSTETQLLEAARQSEAGVKRVLGESEVGASQASVTSTEETLAVRRAADAEIQKVRQARISDEQNSEILIEQMRKHE